MATLANSWRSAALAALLLGPAGVAACAQYSPHYTPPPPPLTTGPCVPTKKDPCAPPAAPTSAQTPVAPTSTGNPFPGETSAPTTPPATPAGKDPFAFPGEPATPPKSAADGKFPFPGEPPATPSSSSSSSSSTPDATPDATPNAPSGSPTPAAARSTRRKLPKVEQSLSDRESEDLDVSHFYLQSGNFHAAYLRAQDAVHSIPSDPDAHFALALAAEKMKKNDEAVSELKACLKLDSCGDHTSVAQKTLAELDQK